MINLTAIGRVGKDAEVRDVKGKKVVNFNIAVDTGYGENKKTVWLTCSMWNKENLAQYLKKGTSIYIAGEPSTRAYSDKDGKAACSLDVTVFAVELLGGSAKQESEPKKQEAQPSYKKEATASEFIKSLDDSDSDLPF